jgi:hypothetical protein
MRNIVMLLLIVICAVTTPAQEASVVFHPGELIHILVSFKTPPATIDGGVFSFGLVSQPDRAQEPLIHDFQGNQVKKINDTQFEISGSVPDHIVSGTFRLNWINIVVKGVGKQYSVKTDFKELTVTILNPEHPEFPVIDDVKLAPRN